MTHGETLQGPRRLYAVDLAYDVSMCKRVFVTCDNLEDAIQTAFRDEHQTVLDWQEADEVGDVYVEAVSVGPVGFGSETVLEVPAKYRSVEAKLEEADALLRDCVPTVERAIQMREALEHAEAVLSRSPNILTSVEDSDAGPDTSTHHALELVRAALEEAPR